MRDGAKAFFLDLDGTLLPSGASFPNDIDISAIAQARAQGHFVFLNSGRSYAYLPNFVKQADFGLDGLICGNGSYILTSGKVAFSVRIPDEALIAMTPFYDSGSAGWVVFEGEQSNYTLHHKRETGTEITSVSQLLTDYAPSCVTKITGDGVAPECLHKLLDKWFWICQLDTYYEAMIKGCSKASGIDRALAICGVPLENAVAIGDSANDVDMLRHAGVGVAMGNATSAALAAADETTEDCFHGGVAKTIEKYTR